jgi:hypothetical protein
VDHSAISIGWDVGGWNCDKNRDSRDALVVLDARPQRLGRPWRGTLRRSINDASSAAEFVASLLQLCDVPGIVPTSRVTISIEHPLFRFSQLDALNTL